MKRREFLIKGSLATVAGWSVLGNREATAQATAQQATNKQAADKQATNKQASNLLVLATNWGFSGSIDQFCAAAKKEGYDGVEVGWPGKEDKIQREWAEALDKHRLQAGFLCGAWQSDPQEHYRTFTEIVNAATGNPYLKPIYINCHSGRDHYDAATNAPYIEYTTRRSAETRIPIYHETHRGRMCFAAHTTRQFLEQHPELELTLDISHWCNVHESMLSDQEAAVNLALQRTSHIHARVGHPEGPQVNDPRAKEWVHVVEQHYKWWDVVVERHKKAGKRLTILTEFGPPTYMPTMPHSQQPVADQWAINVHMMQEIRKRYQ